MNNPTRSRHYPKEIYIAFSALAGIALHLVLRFIFNQPPAVYDVPLYFVLLCGLPLIKDLLKNLINFQFSSDLLAGISIITAIILGQYLAGALVVLMLSGGEALESYAQRKASYILQALAKRMPQIAHRKVNQQLSDISTDEIKIGDILVVFPHEYCPVDGTVIEGQGSMDESFLTGEPYVMSKTPGVEVISGAINGTSAITIRADKLPIDSRYAKIMRVMELSAQTRPRIRRLGDQLGGIYTPLAVAIGIIAWIVSHDPLRFLAVMVIATPCPLLIAIPTTIIGSISLAAKRGIIIKDPAVLERLDTCRTIIFDKTGTLTYGRPTLTDIHCAPTIKLEEVIHYAASLERYSKHPLANAILERAKKQGITIETATAISERPGEGLSGTVSGKEIQITSREKLLKQNHTDLELVPPTESGLECVILLENRYAATFRFHDTPRKDSHSFVSHLAPHHGFDSVILLSGDRESETRYLAESVGIREIYYNKSPEEKVEIVKDARRKAPTVFVGDGINDAPALMQATVGIAFGQHSDITTEAAGAVILESSLERIDELFHIGKRMRSIALQSAVGGMALSVVGMFLAMGGYLHPVAGAIGQEIIDLAAVINALRAATAPKILTDF